MIWTLRYILAAVLAGDFLLLCVAVLLVSISRRLRPRKREPETAPPREIQEDLEAWRRIQNYNAADAYGIGGGG
ncbi:MAG: hypothetical protein IJR48_02835 [Oscillibacter sp.]|nr:hypothetical protein [Oscillibacter sp.]MBQ9617276.1 hypothetical protein [Oscillibacter sp.]